MEYVIFGIALFSIITIVAILIAKNKTSQEELEQEIFEMKELGLSSLDELRLLKRTYTIIDKCTRQEVQGKAFFYNGLGAGSVDTPMVYVLICKSHFNNQISEQIVTVDVYYKKQIGETIIFASKDNSEE